MSNPYSKQFGQYVQSYVNVFSLSALVVQPRALRVSGLRVSGLRSHVQLSRVFYN